MRRITPIFLCLLLLIGTVCPAFCMQPAARHACCHTKAAGTLTSSCGHSELAQSQGRNASPAQTAIQLVETTYQLFSAHRSVAQLAPIASAPRPQASPHRILRI